MTRFGFVLRAVGALVVVLAVSFVSTGAAEAVSHVGTIAGTGSKEFNGDRPGRKANIEPSWMVSDPVGGELYFVDGHSLIRKVTESGQVETVAGTGSIGFHGDGDALDTNINPEWLVFDPASGELYFTDGGTRIRRLTTHGRVETVAGTGERQFNGDQAALETNIAPRLLLLDPVGGELYFNDDGSRIRKVARIGTVETVAGTGDREYNGDRAAREVNITPSWMAFDPVGGGLHFADGESRIRTVIKNRVETIAGTGDKQSNGDHGALDTNIRPGKMVFDPVGGELHFVDSGISGIRKVTRGSRVETIAGTGSKTFNGDHAGLETNISPD